MDVTIGFVDSPLEVVFSSDQSADDLLETIDHCLRRDDAALRLVDDRNRRHLIRAAQVAYIVLAPSGPPPRFSSE